MRLILCLCLLFALPTTTTWAEEVSDVVACSSDGQVCINIDDFETSLCSALDVLSNRHKINPHFFTRLIWQESRFNPNARSPANAQGIAQFIPSTAKIRGLSDPWNPALALDASAKYLSELIETFGNEGLAAVAYNGGESRARNFIKGSSGLASETWNYVQIVTDTDATTWRDAPPKNHDFRLSPDKEFMSACLDLAQNRKYTKFKALPQYKPWGVQLAAGSSKVAAQASFRRRSASCKASLRRKSVDYVYKRSAARGGKAMHNARISFDTRSAANGFCTRLRKSGCACAVYKN